MSLEVVRAELQMALKAVFHCRCRLANGGRNNGIARALMDCCNTQRGREKLGDRGLEQDRKSGRDTDTGEERKRKERGSQKKEQKADREKRTETDKPRDSKGQKDLKMQHLYPFLQQL